MITAVIAEDEPLLREELAARLAEAWPELVITASIEDGAAALEEINARAPDFAFLDIRMPGISGIDVAAALAAAGSRTHVVFVTAYHHYAVQAFDQGALDYLLKPVTTERLAQCVARLRARANTLPGAMAATALADLATALKAKFALEPRVEPIRWLTASVGNETRLIMVEDILYIQADNKYSVVMTASGEALIRKPIKELLAGLEPAMFRQVHRSTIVNLRAIRSIVRDESGRGIIRLRERDDTLTVSQPFMHLFRGM